MEYSLRQDREQSDLPEAIVIGLHAGGLAIGRVLRRLGFSVLGFYVDEAEPGRMSSCFSRVSPLPQEPVDLAGIPRNNCPAPLPVFLTSDKALNWSRHYENLSPRLLHFFQPEERIYRTWFEKTTMADVGGSLAAILNSPRSSLLAEWEAFSRKHIGPWVIKPADSIVGERHNIPKIQLVSNTHELRFIAEKYNAIGSSILLQEWIPGSDDQHAFVGGYVGKSGQISIVQTGRKLKQYPKGMGVSIHSKLESIPDLDVCAREILEKMGHRGFFEFEWKWDARVDQWRFIEINLRPWATLSLSSGYGLRLIQKCLDDIGIIIDDRFPEELVDPVEWVDDFTLALQAIRFRCGYPLRFSRRVAHAYWDKRDPRPLLFQWRQLITNNFRHH